MRGQARVTRPGDHVTAGPRRSEAKLITEPELEPKQEALVGVGEAEAEDLSGAGEAVSAGGGVDV